MATCEHLRCIEASEEHCRYQVYRGGMDENKLLAICLSLNVSTTIPSGIHTKHRDLVPKW